MLAVSRSVMDQPGTIAFLVVFGMGVLCYFLFRSMAKHLRKVNMAARAEEEAQARAKEQSDQPASPATVPGPDAAP